MGPTKSVSYFENQKVDEYGVRGKLRLKHPRLWSYMIALISEDADDILIHHHESDQLMYL